MNVDDCIKEMWKIENELTPDGSGWVTFDAFSDMWWVINAYCSHGPDYDATKSRTELAVATAGSTGASDLEAGFIRLLNEFRRAHDA